MNIEDVAIQCPFCWETITIEVDPSVARQDYIEDCSVCCNPIRIRFSFDRADGAVSDLVVEQS